MSKRISKENKNANNSRKNNRDLLTFKPTLIAFIFIARNFVRAALKLPAASFNRSKTNTVEKSFRTSSVIRAIDENSSDLAAFSCVPENPLDLFTDLLTRVNDSPILFNLATIDKKFGILNRTMNYIGIEDCAITYSTPTKARGFKNIKRNSKVSATFMFLNVGDEMWQVRLFDAVAVELNAEQIAKKWDNERLFSKIRHHISTCGEEINPVEYKQKHDELLQQVQCENKKLKQTKSYTVMKIEPKRWDFYKAQQNQIGARVQYRKTKDEDPWNMLHISA